MDIGGSVYTIPKADPETHPTGDHWWMSMSNDALLGYYCQDCGIEDWHNEHHRTLRADHLEWKRTFKFVQLPVTFVLLEDQKFRNKFSEAIAK